MPDEQTQTTASGTSGTSGRTYLVFRYTTAADIRKHLDDGTIAPDAEFLVPAGSQVVDEADDAIRASAKAENDDTSERAAVPERNFRRRKPRKRVTEVWGFED